ncbi:MAG: leucine-rich repeat domain-containing protein, partial [Asgard group archaeon]|nr:leucine-rich repeat domain-containing protein [Asgard group archaeon]
LQELRLGFNEVSVLPENFGNLKNLEKFYFQKNWLNAIPESFTKLKKLTHLNLNQVQMTKVSDVLLKLPNLKFLWIQPDWWQEEREEGVLNELEKKGCKIYN